MKRKMTDSDMPIGKMMRVNDPLPPPEELALPQEMVKVTLSLSKTSIDFFKRQAKQNNTQYQKMIRQLLDRYTTHYSSKKAA